MMKKYELYLFDFDGTIFNTLDSLIDAYRLAFLKYGIVPKKDEYAKFLMQSIQLAFASKGGKKEDENDFIVYFRSQVDKQEVIDKTKLYEETLDFFKYLHNNSINYGIVTGSSSKRVIDILNHFNIPVNKLKVVVGNDIYQFAKPNPDPILIALKKTNYINRKDKVVYVGDALQDQKCAAASGIDYYQVNRSSTNLKDFEIKSLLDLFN